MSHENKKLLSELDLLDRFLFAEAIEDPIIAQMMLEIILGKDVVLKYLPQTEKEVRTSMLKRFVKLDVWMVDQDDVVYDAEVQKRDTKNLPKRSRYYQSVMDSKLLEPGETEFNQLQPVCTIIIAPFDIGGKGLYRYTYRMKCDEAPELNLDDGAVRIFLNTRGAHPELVSPELAELLRYIENTTTEISKQCTSERIKEMHRRIEKLRSNEEVRMRYLRELEDRLEARKEAREEERRGNIRIFVWDKLEDGVAPEKIMDKLQRYYQLPEESANEYVKHVAEEFVKAKKMLGEGK